MKILKPKTIIILLTALVALVYFWLYLNRYLYKPKAAAEKVNVTFVPTSGDFKVGEKKTLDVIIQTTDSTKKISGIDLSFTASGSLSILGLTPPAPYPLASGSKLSQSQVLYDVKEKQTRVAYVFLNPDDQLPSALILKMDFQGTASGSGTVKLVTDKSQIVGNVSGGIYEFGKVDETNFNFSGQITTSPIPTVNPNCLCLKDDTCDTSCNFMGLNGASYKCSLPSSLFLTPPTQDNKNSWCKRTHRPQGDADGNGIIEKVDYYYYVAAVNGGKIPSTVNADFNGDSEVGVADRGIVTNTLNNPPQCKVNSDCPQVACTPCQEGQPCPTCPAIQCVNSRCLQLPPAEENCIKTDTGEKMSFQEAKEIALKSDCVKEGSLKDEHFCNPGGTWWIDLNIQKQGCLPACVINVVTKKAEINWRCTGLN